MWCIFSVLGRGPVARPEVLANLRRTSHCLSPVTHMAWSTRPATQVIGMGLRTPSAELEFRCFVWDMIAQTGLEHSTDLRMT